MGIRVHKVLGYGLCDLGVDEKGYNIEDPRIRPEFDTYPDGGVRAYLDWLEEKIGPDHLGSEVGLDFNIMRERLVRQSERRVPALSDAIAYSPEFGLASVIVFTPLHADDWRRFDDPIDWIEETYLREDAQSDDVSELRHGIYPWSGSYMNWHTGEPIDDKIMPWIRANNPDAGVRDGELDLLARAAGLRDHAHAQEVVRPTVPVEIRHLVEYLGVFARPDGWRHLRPMLYTYWS